MQRLRFWLQGIRAYIAIGIVLLTVEVAWWAHSLSAGTNLFAVRAEGIYAWLTVFLLAVVLTIGPAYKIWPKLPGKQLMGEARRMLGIGAAWFATLHVMIAEFGLFKGANPLHLSPTIAWGFVLGITALGILLIMTLISFNAAMRVMGIWWFRVQRLVYVAAVLIIIHAILNGAHAAQPSTYVWLLCLAVGVICLQLIAWHKRRSAK